MIRTWLLLTLLNLMETEETTSETLYFLFTMILGGQCVATALHSLHKHMIATKHIP